MPVKAKDRALVRQRAKMAGFNCGLREVDGENMVRYHSVRVRYFTIKESARLQTFPNDYLIHGSWTESMRQLGNAVPVTLAEIVARSIYQSLHRDLVPAEDDTNMSHVSEFDCRSERRVE